MKLNRAHAVVGTSHQENKEDIGAPIKLDAEAQAHIEKHRYAIFVLICEWILQSPVECPRHSYPRFLHCTRATYSLGPFVVRCHYSLKFVVLETIICKLLLEAIICALPICFNFVLMV
jgi:hypothetical protein